MRIVTAGCFPEQVLAMVRGRLSLAAALATAAAVLTLIAPPSAYCLVQAGAAGRALVGLAGTLSIAQCDRPICDRPPDADPRWRNMSLGQGGLDSQLPHGEGVSWVRVRFTVDEPETFREPAILITKPADAGIVAVNGTNIGSRGRVADYYEVAPAGPWLFRFPPGLLRRGSNELLIQALFTGRRFEAFDGPVLLGDFAALAVEAGNQRQPIIAMEAVFLSMFLFLLLFYGFLLSHGVLRSEYLLFTVFTAICAVVSVLGSNLMLWLGVDGPLLQMAQEVLSSVLVLVMLSLVTSATGGGAGWVFISLLALGTVFVMLDAFLPPLVTLFWMSGPRKVYLAAVGVYYLFMSGRAVMRRREEATPILLGVAAYAIGSRIELFWGIAMSDYAIGVFAVCMLYALTSRHARLQNRLVSISSRLLDAHEEERRRIARDIHDTVGQSLLALRWRLQMLGSRTERGAGPPPGALDGLAQDTAAILDEVRRAALDLRPPFLETMSLRNAIQWCVDQFCERHRIVMRVHVGSSTPLVDPPPRIKDNIYRLFLEILANAVRHSEATRIDVSLYNEGRLLVLTVTDDGRGFDTTAGRGPGIGLSTMRERAELLGGLCSIESRQGRGTTVDIRVPLA